MKSNLKKFFEPNSIVVVGVSHDETKVGHVLFRNILEGGFKGKLFGVNPSGGEIAGKKINKKISELSGIDLGIIAVPAPYVLGVVKECKKVGINNLVIVSAGFSEIGNKREEEKLRKYLQENSMRAVGVNCLGLLSAHNNLDALFIPRYRMQRPEPGKIGFICQSGAVGAAIVDKATDEHHKFSNFVSYGNATDIDESDLLKYYGEDKKTKVICMYIEGVKDGEKFYKTLRSVSKRKPVVILKGGQSEAGSHAAISHTGSLAGSAKVFRSVVRQAGGIIAENLEDLFLIGSLIEKETNVCGNRIQVITNGGGYGIISTDAISRSRYLEMAKPSKNTLDGLKSKMPSTVTLSNPMDLVGDATNKRYLDALEACGKDKNIDAILLIVLYQTPRIQTDIVETITRIHKKIKKPIMVVSTGGDFTEYLSEYLEKRGIAVYSYPEDAVRAMDSYVDYLERKKRLI